MSVVYKNDFSVRENHPDKLQDLEKDISDLLNKRSIDSLCNTPDYIIASMLINCLVGYIDAVNELARWYEPDVVTVDGDGKATDIKRG